MKKSFALTSLVAVSLAAIALVGTVADGQTHSSGEVQPPARTGEIHAAGGAAASTQVVMPPAVALRSTALGVKQPRISTAALAPSLAMQERSTPRWVKWGLIGAAAGAITFAVFGRADLYGDTSPVLQDAAVGAAIGFVIVGGSVALHDSLCRPDSLSERAGMC